MLREAPGKVVKKIAAPLWTLIRGSDKEDFDRFNILRSGACSIVAQLAYFAVGEEERKQRNRATVVPSEIFQELLMAEYFDLVAALADRDFAGTEVVRTDSFVAVLIPAETLLLVGVRGTKFAYDWIINLNASKSSDPAGQRFHRGFLGEANELGQALRQRIPVVCQKFKGRSSPSKIWFAGHSLGGAISAILNQQSFQIPIEACYTFGAPRISNETSLPGAHPLFATRRHLDVVPRCPPRAFGYADFSNQHFPDGSFFKSATDIEISSFARWLMTLAIKQIPKNHSMERYGLEVIEKAKSHPAISEDRRPDFDLALKAIAAAQPAIA